MPNGLLVSIPSFLYFRFNKQLAMEEPASTVKRAERRSATGRSMIEILGKVSAGVEIPADDVGRASRKDRNTKQSLGVTAEIPDPRAFASKPDANEVFAAIPYRNYWFWVSL